MAKNDWAERCVRVTEDQKLPALYRILKSPLFVDEVTVVAIALCVRIESVSEWDDDNDRGDGCTKSR